MTLFLKQHQSGHQIGQIAVIKDCFTGKVSLKDIVYEKAIERMKSVKLH